MDLRKLYDKNMDFKNYVDRYSKHYNEGKSISIEEALSHLVVRNVAEYYVECLEEAKPKTMNATSENGMKALF